MRRKEKYNPKVRDRDYRIIKTTISLFRQMCQQEKQKRSE